MARLVVCGACERHVHDTEDQCPFCDAPIVRAPREPAIPGLSRAAHVALLTGAAVSAAMSASCSDGAKSPADTNTAHPPDTTANTAGATTGPDVVTTATTTATSTGTAMTTATGTATTTATTTSTGKVGGIACGAGKCAPGQYCLHPCTPCGGRAAQAGNCPPQAPPTCMSGAPPPNAQIQGNGDVYQFCPAMPYGCVFPNDCGRVTV